MYILGISSFYHDSAVALIRDGTIVVAVEEERFSRIKHDNQFPFKAAEFCLKEAAISIEEIDAVAYYEKPLLKFERILTNFVQTYPFSIKQFISGLPTWLSHKIKVEHIIRKKLKYKGKIFFVSHHLSHAAAAFYTSPFESSAVATIDGVGEYQTTGLWSGGNRDITSLKLLEYPHSLGLIYSTFTAFCGFKVNEDEYKLMGLSAYGKPSFLKKINKLIDLRHDGSFHLNMDYFAFGESDVLWSSRFEELFGKPRRPEEKVTERYMNIAASIQTFTEDVYFKILNHLFALTKNPRLCIGGGVALNALANGKIIKETSFKDVHIYGAAGDNGASMGAALFAYHSLLKKPRKSASSDLKLGSKYSNKEIEKVLQQYNLSYIKSRSESQLMSKCAQLLRNNCVIGWFQERMEFGPRALGARSILASPESKFMKEKVNKIKRREQFRPFGGVVMQQHAHELFDVPKKNYSSPYMVFCYQVKKPMVYKIPAIVHKDGSCRIQTVNPSSGRVYKLVKKFYELTNIPCLINTSFNVGGEPIVESPGQAVNDFLHTQMDYLVIGDFIVSKKLRKE